MELYTIKFHSLPKFRSIFMRGMLQVTRTTLTRCQPSNQLSHESRKEWNLFNYEAYEDNFQK